MSLKNIYIYFFYRCCAVICLYFQPRANLMLNTYHLLIYFDFKKKSVSVSVNQKVQSSEVFHFNTIQITMLAKPIQFIRNVYNLLSKRWHANNRHPLQTHASTWIKTERICHQNTPIPHYQGFCTSSLRKQKLKLD